MRYLSILFLVSWFNYPQTVFSQDTLLHESDLYRFADAVVYTYTQPTRWKKKDFIRLAGLLAGTAAITLIDEPVRDFFQRTQPDFPNEVEVIGFHLGKPYSAFITTGTFYLVGAALNDKWAKETGIQLGVTLLTSGLLQTISKDLIGRARPGTGEGVYSFQPFSGKAAYHSFLSGHVSVAFGTSLVVASRIRSLPMKIFFYSLAATTALSRMHTDAHWLSDIAFGGALAWFCNKTAVKRLTQTNRGKRRGRLGAQWTFFPSPRGASLLVKL
jgi:membrane-associated phospholipid phosphatase